MQVKITTDAFKTPELCNIHLGGHTGKIMERFFHERIFSEFARNVAYKETEDAFRNRIDDEYPSGGIWQGEYWGKHMISACEVYRYTRDPELLSFIQKAADTLLSFQREDGYIGTYRNSSNWFVIPKEDPNGPEGPYRGWNWNIWCRKYTLWGLLECYDVTKDEKILTAANRHALQLIDELEQNGTDIADTGTFAGMPSCSILKPMLLLYRHTQNSKLLDFAVSIADNWERADNKCPNLIANALSRKPLTQWYPSTDKWAKAYEMMSCYEGILELYRVTGTQKYLRATECFYEILMEHERNPVFSVAYNDIFADAAYEVNAISEPCDAIHFMRLCHELYLLTGSVKYMDTFEQTFYNAFLAGIFRDGRWGARGVRGAGRHFYVLEQAKMIYNHCCVNNMPRAFLTMARSAVVCTENAVAVNLYDNLTASTNTADITVDSTYFTNGKVTVRAGFRSYPMDILLRIPGWCAKAEVNINGTVVQAGPGYFRASGLKRNNTITICFAIAPRICAFSKPLSAHPEGDWKKRRFLNLTSVSSVPERLWLERPKFTVMYGPLLLAKSKMIGSSEEELHSSAPLSGAEVIDTWQILPSKDVRLKMALSIPDPDGVRQFTVCDYASAANEKLSDDDFFSIYF